jgi:uncharacterized protein affecting Mg2+/Co2+ transport
MEGSFAFIRENGDAFEAQIGRFFLAPSAAPLSAED